MELFSNILGFVKQDKIFVILTAGAYFICAILWFYWLWRIQTEIFPMIFLSVVILVNSIISFVLWSRDNFSTYLLPSLTIFIEFLFFLTFYNSTEIAR